MSGAAGSGELGDGRDGARFDETARLLTGGVEPIEHGSGRWLEDLVTKGLYSQLLRSPAFSFAGRDDWQRKGGAEALVADDLLQPGRELPPGFTLLRAMVQRIIQRPG